MTEPKNYYDPNDTRRFVDRYRQDVLVEERNALAARVQELEELGDAGAFRELADAHNELRDHNLKLLAEIKRQEGWVNFYQDLQDKSEAEIARLRDALGNAPEALFKMPFQMKREVAIEALRDYVDAALEEKQ